MTTIIVTVGLDLTTVIRLIIELVLCKKDSMAIELARNVLRNTSLEVLQNIILEMFLEKNLTEKHMKENYAVEYEILTTIFGTILWDGD